MKGHWKKARRKSYPLQDSKMAMIHELPNQRNIHLTGYSKCKKKDYWLFAIFIIILVAEDSRSLASELAPACRPRSSRRGSKRLSIKDVFSSSMLSGFIFSLQGALLQHFFSSEPLSIHWFFLWKRPRSPNLHWLNHLLQLPRFSQALSSSSSIPRHHRPLICF